MHERMADAINWLPRGLSIVNHCQPLSIVNPGKRPDQMVDKVNMVRVDSVKKRPDEVVNKVNMAKVFPKPKPVAMVKPIAMVRPLKRENPENFRKDSPCKKFKASEGLVKLDELSRYATDLNQPMEVTKVGQKTSIPSEHQKTNYLSPIDTKDVGDSTPQPELLSKTEILENQCGDCYKIMKSAKTVVDHKKKFRCPGKKFGAIKETDLKDFKTKKSLSEEKAAEGELNKGEEEIQAEFKTISTNDTNTKSATEARQLSCSGCHSEFSHAKSLQKHIKTDGCKNSGVKFSIKSYQNKCPDCGSRFKENEGLEKHVNSNECKKNNILEKGKSTEEFSTSEGKREIQNLNELKCGKCERQFNYGNNFRKHVEKDLCQKYQKEILTTHELISGRCNTCDKKFNYRRHLRKHVKTAICVKYNKCNECDREFSHVSNLRRHKQKLSCQKDEKPSTLAANLTRSSTKTQTEEPESIIEAERSSPSEDMLTSAIDQLMTTLDKEKTTLDKEKVEQTKGGLKRKKLNKKVVKDTETLKGKENAEATWKEVEEKSDLLVCGLISTPTGKISVVRPRIAQKSGSEFNLGRAKNTFLESGSDFELGMAKLQFLASRLFKCKLTLATVIAATRFNTKFSFQRNLKYNF